MGTDKIILLAMSYIQRKKKNRLNKRAKNSEMLFSRYLSIIKDKEKRQKIKKRARIDQNTAHSGKWQKY